MNRRLAVFMMWLQLGAGIVVFAGGAHQNNGVDSDDKRACVNRQKSALRPLSYGSHCFLDSDSLALEAKHIRSAGWFAMHSGWGYRTGKSPDKAIGQLKDYMDGLRGGWVLQADMGFYVSPHMGFGGKYIRHDKSQRFQDYLFVEEDVLVHKDIKDHIVIEFLGPTVQYEFASKSRKQTLKLGLGMGYLHYHSESRIFQDDMLVSGPLEVEGKTLGFVAEVFAAFDVHKGLCFTLGTTYTAGRAAQLDCDLPEFQLGLTGQNDHLSHLDIVAGLVYKL